MRLLWLLALVAVVPPAATAAAPAAGVPVLMYHKVDAVTPRDPVGRSLTLAPATFEAQLQWLRAHKIRTLTMNELADALRRGEPPSHAVVLTFDDGYTDSATVVTPLLRKYGDVGSFYVSANFIGDGRHASWPQLRAMRAAGMEVGCHGSRHLDLSRIGRAQAAYEVDHCVAALTHYLARPTTYAYPAGKWDTYTLTLMRQAGIKAALTERPGVVTSLAAPYTLPRRRIDRSAGLASFAVLASP